jgi:hypothetical protein
MRRNDCTAPRTTTRNDRTTPRNRGGRPPAANSRARLQERDALLGLGVEERDALLEPAFVRLPRLQQRRLAHRVAAARRQRRHRRLVLLLRRPLLFKACLLYLIYIHFYFGPLWAPASSRAAWQCLSLPPVLLPSALLSSSACARAAVGAFVWKAAAKDGERLQPTSAAATLVSSDAIFKLN